MISKRKVLNRWFCIAAICLLSLSSLQALELEIQQKLQQGDLVRGTTDANSLQVLGRTVDVDAQGRFVFGLGRNVQAELPVILLSDSGEKEKLILTVEQREYNTQSIEGVPSKYVSPPKEVSERIRSDTSKVKAARAVYSTGRYDYLAEFIWPAKGPISGVYGSQRIFNGVPKRPHYGLDIAAPTGAPVIAPAAGRVTLAHDDMYYSGGTLIVDHGRGISSTFIHLSRLHVTEGDDIKQGQLIAEVGATGRTTGPHLDWRINWFDQRLDPELLLPPPRD